MYYFVLKNISEKIMYIPRLLLGHLSSSKCSCWHLQYQQPLEPNLNNRTSPIMVKIKSFNLAHLKILLAILFSDCNDWQCIAKILAMHQAQLFEHSQEISSIKKLLTEQHSQIDQSKEISSMKSQIKQLQHSNL